MIELDTIYNEDCLEGMKRIPDGSVDMVCCDLPYEVLNKDNPHAQWDRIIPFEPLWEQYKRVTKPNAAIVLFCQGMFTAQLMMSQPKLWRYNLVWDKTRAVGFLNARRMPLRSHEDICVFYQQPPTYNPQMTKGTPNHSRGRLEGEQTNRCYGKVNKPTDIFTEYKFPKSIIGIPNLIEGNFHPTQKPVNLIRYLIRTYSDKGGIILDNCMGSGTTAIACMKEKRHYIGFELNEEYYRKSLERIEKERMQLTLDFDP